MFGRLSEKTMDEIPECIWEYDEFSGTWVTECGEMFTFNDAGPKENGFSYCPYCGLSLYSEEEEE